jgi:hypothetical protein
MTRHIIRNEEGRIIGGVNENTTFAEIKLACPNFFKSHTWAKRETFHMYRGQLIVRHTIGFSPRGGFWPHVFH